jgi:hypothetical protein
MKALHPFQELPGGLRYRTIHSIYFNTMNDSHDIFWQKPMGILNRSRQLTIKPHTGASLDIAQDPSFGDRLDEGTRR